MKFYRVFILLDDGEEDEFVLEMDDNDTLFDQAAQYECWERGLRFVEIITIEVEENNENI